MEITTLAKIVETAEKRQQENFAFFRNLEIYEGQFNKYVFNELAQELTLESLTNDKDEGKFSHQAVCLGYLCWYFEPLLVKNSSTTIKENLFTKRG